MQTCNRTCLAGARYRPLRSRPKTNLLQIRNIVRFAPAKRRQVARFRRPNNTNKAIGDNVASSRPALPYERKAVLRFLNPWVDVAHMAKQDACLGTEVATYTETWGLVSVLLCGLSVTALAGMPCENNKIEKQEDNVAAKKSTVLMSWGLLSSHEQQHDCYIAACMSAFFGSASSLGLTTVLNVLASVTPNPYMRIFVVRHSWQLCAIPFLTAVSGGFVGMALAIGIDLTNNQHVARITLGGFALTTLLVSSAAIHGQLGLYRALSASSRAARRNF